MDASSSPTPAEIVRAWRDTPERRRIRQTAFSECLFDTPTPEVLSRWRGHKVWSQWRKEDNQLSALLLACLQPTLPDAILPFLLGHGLDVRDRTASGQGALHLVCLGSRRHRLAWCQALVAAGADLGAVDEAGHTPLLAAARQGAGDVFDFLLEQGATPTEADRQAIFQANHANILATFWERFGMQASRRARTRHCLEAAAQSRWHLVRSVLPYGVDLHARREGETLLLMTYRSRKFPADVAEELVRMGADPEQTHAGSGLTLRGLIRTHYRRESPERLAGRLRAADEALARGMARRMDQALPSPCARPGPVARARRL